MNNSVKIRLKLEPSNPETPLGAEVWLDQTKHFDSDHVKKDTLVVLNFDDDTDQHELRVVLKNKRPEHTKIDSSGQIIEDSVLSVSNVSFEEIDLGHLMNKIAVYSHDFNGTGDKIQDKFYGKMGCNGVLSLKFSTPFYLWLLENM